ncbi:SNF2 family N-terminal domain-containing protein [Apiosordaria backusii]|uniref:SNF2 family N-terminal domain-containing protein n=1 Tax=Apiosordaria backusii TaxID=314023 RepID=A0AA40EXT9_9PEZI|nr:SNF2 family N-terminal domain-containing protein [Apiosordaria backusii]
MEEASKTTYRIGPHEILTDSSISAFSRWEDICENDPSALPIASEVFDSPNERPITELAVLGQAWSQMEDWATSCGLQYHAVAEMVEDETREAGGVQFCCYGMICQTEVKLVGNMLALMNEIDNGQETQSFNVTQHEAYFMLMFPRSNLLFAQINQALSPALTSLKDLGSVEVKAFANTRHIRSVSSKANTLGQAKLRVDVNIYGSVADAKAVGARLSASKMFLQDPEYGMDNIEYMNPQLIHFPGFEEPTVVDKPRMDFDTQKNKDLRRVRDQRELFDQRLSQIYSDLQRYRKLKRIEGAKNYKLLTNLYPHQEEALNFMEQREFGPMPDEFSLWTPETSSYTKTPFYRHKLTGVEHHGEKPSECGGGILADETGMGKSLSILALITSTLQQAAQWSKDEAGASRTSRSKATLIMVPSTLIMNSWFNEIEKHLDKSLRITRYYGKERNVDPQIYLDSDLVFTTYHTVAASHKETDSSALFHIEWFRIVLDEAHLIKRQETTLFRAASQILANFRWCLTATPIQNRLEELGSLIAFLRIDQLENKNIFRNKIVAPFLSDTDMEVAPRQFTLLLDAICLRRPKHMLNLPQIKELPRYIELSEEERHRYDKTLEDMTHWIKEKASRHADRQDHFGIFQAQLQLRLVCNHGTFQKAFRRYGRRDRRLEREEFLYALGRSANVDCSSCGITMPAFDALEPEIRRFDHDCGHVICQDCFQFQNASHDSTSATSCSFCYRAANRRVVSAAQECQNTSREDEPDAYFHRVGFSSKMDALMKDLEGSPAGTKSIVFSCWTRTLDLVSQHLKHKNIPHQRIDGRQTLTERQRNMDQFISDGGIPVLLMSTGVGAFGLNLTAANHVYILEPQWNPSVESQAVGRVARLGQKKDVLVTRYLVRGTVEIQMHAQQLHKTKLAEIGWDARQVDDDMGTGA